MFIGFGAGSPTDLQARVVVDEARKHIPNNQPIVVINRPGAAQGVALSELYRTRPDGYRIMFIAISGLAIQPHFGVVPFTHDSFTPIMGATEATLVFAVRADAPWRTLAEFVEHARKNPRQVVFGSSGTGTGPHLAPTYWSRDIFGIEMVHIPFDGGALAMNALLGGHVDAASFAGLAVDRTRLRPLVIQGISRTPALQDVPTFRELGYDFGYETFFGLVAPPGTPPEVVAVIHDAFKKALEDQTTIRRLEGLNVMPHYLSGTAWQEAISRNFRLNGEIMRRAGLITN